MDAYLVIFIDTTATPPYVVGAGIYSEPHPTSDLLMEQPVKILTLKGATYADARNKIIELIARAPHYAWIGKLSRKDWSVPSAKKK